MKRKYNRIVVKIGSSSLTHSGGELNMSRIDHFLRQLVDLKDQEREVLFVTSAAIGAGMAQLGLKERPGSIPEQQAMAAVGQAQLMAVYNSFLKEYGEVGGQILLTSSDLEDRSRYLNAFNTVEALLKNGVIPIINENDTTATQEIKFGDNDTLSARVAGLVEADLLIILSDVPGLYNGEPDSKREDLKLIRKVDKITDKIEQLAGGKGSLLGTGGMYTKIEAARIAVDSGITMVIGPGYEDYIIQKIVRMLEEGEEYYTGTTFLPGENILTKRKQWLYYNLPVSGSIKIDSGAEEALVENGKSLLPGGITNIKGSFEQGDLVSIINQTGEILGSGLANYSAGEIERIKGRHSEEIKDLLGYFNREEIIHRDNMVIK